MLVIDCMLTSNVVKVCVSGLQDNGTKDVGYLIICLTWWKGVALV